MAEIRSLLDEVIEAEIENLSSLTFGSDEESKAIRNIAALHKLRIDEMKAQTEADEKRERRMMDSEQRRAELALKEREQAGKELTVSAKKRSRDSRPGTRQSTVM